MKLITTLFASRTSSNNSNDYQSCMGTRSNPLNVGAKCNRLCTYRDIGGIQPPHLPLGGLTPYCFCRYTRLSVPDEADMLFGEFREARFFHFKFIISRLPTPGLSRQNRELRLFRLAQNFMYRYLSLWFRPLEEV